MEQYIPKAAVVAEIEKVISGLRGSCNPNPLGNMEECLADAEIEALNLIKDSLDTIKAKEVDLDALGTLAEHLIACDAHGIAPKYRDGELDILEGLANNKAQKGE